MSTSRELIAACVCVLFAAQAVAADLFVAAPKADPPGLYRLDRDGRSDEEAAFALEAELPGVDFFVFDDAGDRLYAIADGNRRGDTVAMFDVGKDGILHPAGAPLPIGQPICVQFRPGG